MTKEDDNHDSNTTEIPNNETSKQYFQYLHSTRKNLNDNDNQKSENQNNSTQERILESLINLTKQFQSISKDNYLLKQEVFKNKFQSSTLNPSSFHD